MRRREPREPHTRDGMILRATVARPATPPLAAALTYAGRGPGWRDPRYWAATVLYVLAVLAKTMVAPLPAVLLVLAWWRDGRLERRAWIPLVPWLVFGAGLGLFTAWMEHSVIGAQGEEYALTFFQRLMLAGRALWFYAGKVVLPGTLMFFYPRWDVPAAAAGWW